MTLDEHRTRLTDAEDALTDAMVCIGKQHKLTALEWVAVLTQRTFHQLASALADQWEGKEPR